MAERERLTNKERRAQAREERKRKEAEEAAKRKRSQLRNGLVTAVVVVAVAAIVLQAFLGGADTVAELSVSAAAAEDAQTAAECELLADREPLEDRTHFEAGEAPPPETIYTATRPTHSGPHNIRPIGVDTYSRQLDEVSSTHNLEHGAIIAWYDDEAVDGSEIASWAESLNASGFEGQGGSGAGIITSPYEDPGLPEGVGVAFRAWGTAMNCGEWNEDVANAFVARNYGTRGVGPERTFAPYPEEVLDIVGEDVEESDAPTDGSTSDEDMTVDEDADTEEPDAEDTEDPDAEDAEDPDAEE